MAVSNERLYEAMRTLTMEIKELKEKEEFMSMEDMCKLIGTSPKNLKNELPKLGLKFSQLKKEDGARVGKIVFKRSDVYERLNKS